MFKYKNQDEVVRAALQISESRLREAGQAFTNPELVGEHVRLKLANEDREHFYVMYLDSQNRLIQGLIEFSGTIDAATVFPREIVRRALALNAASVILSHNHPSGVVKPSPADKVITQKIQAALDLLDMRVLDHVIVAGTQCYSFASMGDL